jgi:hypothetical protein
MIDQETINRMLDRIGEAIKAKAIRNCPIDLGQLRLSINHRIEGNKVIIYSDLDYARDMEFGMPPRLLDEGEKEDLAEWAKRHDMPAYPVIKRIQTQGIKVGSVTSPMRLPNGTYRPFLRPSVFQSIEDIKRIVKEEL